MKCPICHRRVRVGRDDLYVRRSGDLAHIACGTVRPESGRSDDGRCGATLNGAQCAFQAHTRGDHHNAERNVSWYRIGGTVSQYAGPPRVSPKNVAKTPYVKERARVVAASTVAGPPPGSPRVPAHLRMVTTAKGPAWMIVAAATGRVVWAGMTGMAAAAWARANRYAIVRAPDQDEIPATSNDWTTIGTGGSVPSTH